MKLPSAKLLLKSLTSNKWILEQKSKYLNSIRVFSFLFFFFLEKFWKEFFFVWLWWNKRNLQEKTRERSKAVASACNFIEKETLPQVSSCVFCEISKNTFFNGAPPVAASARWRILKRIPLLWNFFVQVSGNRVSDHYARVFL